jgi:hypothetical protein
VSGGNEEITEKSFRITGVLVIPKKNIQSVKNEVKTQAKQHIILF